MVSKETTWAFEQICWACNEVTPPCTHGMIAATKSDARPQTQVPKQRRPLLGVLHSCRTASEVLLFTHKQVLHISIKVLLSSYKAKWSYHAERILTKCDWQSHLKLGVEFQQGLLLALGKCSGHCWGYR